jgi:MFS family permease
MRARVGTDVGRLWAAYAVSTYGTWLAFGAFPLIAVRVLHSPAFAVSLLEAAGLAVAALVAFPLGPWVAHHAKRPTLVAMDLVRFAAMASVPVCHLLGLLSYGQLLVVAVVSGAAGIASSISPARTCSSRTGGSRARAGWRRRSVRRSAGRWSGCSVRSPRSRSTRSATCCPRWACCGSAAATS